MAVPEYSYEILVRNNDAAWGEASAAPMLTRNSADFTNCSTKSRKLLLLQCQSITVSDSGSRPSKLR